MISIKRSHERGQVEIDWLKSFHSFSFGHYYDPRSMNFGHLRVINEDFIKPSSGFATHPHQNMEIITYVIEGAIEHKDSTGATGIIKPGEIQAMSAGSGIRHSEYNPTSDQTTHLLQIWLLPSQDGIKPGYQQKQFGRDLGLKLLVSPDGRDESLPIGQDVDLYRSLLSKGDSSQLKLRNNKAWVQMVKGEIALGDQLLKAGDAAAITEAKHLELIAQSDAEALVFDLI